MSALHGSNISVQLVAISESVQEVPAACRVHLLSRQPPTFEAYIFWIPWLGGEDYTWLNMTISEDTSRDKFHLGATRSALPGGRLSATRRAIDPRTIDTTFLSQYGPEQARKSHRELMAHAGDAFSEPGANCQVLTNGDLRLLPNSPTAAGSTG